jgi:signal transduction histidine kinase
MISMERPEDSTPSKTAGLTRRLPWYAGWMGVAVCGVLVLAYLDSAAWAFSVWVFAWVCAGWLGLQRHPWQASPTYPSGVSGIQVTPQELLGDRWREWLTGWYWQTNEAHQLLALKSPARGADGTDWNALSELLGQRADWWQCWGDEQVWQHSELARMRHCMAQGDGWPGALTVPVPPGLSMLGQAERAEACRVHGAPRYASDGRLLGFHGVIELVLPQQQTGSALAVAPQAMSEAEQEALRYALSHDLRAPLRVVEGFTRIVKEDYGRFLDRVGHDHLERVLAASARMNGMIDAILGQAQLAGTEVAREEVDLSTMAREVGSELALLVPSRSPVSLSVTDGLRVMADPALMRRVMENLIGNALKYSAKVESPRVEVGMMPATDPPVYFVRDNGAGFDMQHADKLFGLFQRLHSAKDFPGTGVGLAGVQNIVRRHGGRVWAEARPGAGACFYFTLSEAALTRQGVRELA